GGPYETGRAVPEQIDRRDGGQVVHAGKDIQDRRPAPAIARLIQVQANAVAMKVDEVRRAASVNVRQSYAALVELVRLVEQRRIFHGDLRAEPTMTQIRPIADSAIADTHEVGQPITAEIREVYRFRAVGEKDTRARFFVGRVGRSPTLCEALRP